MIRSIPAVWDQTLVLPPSEIGEVAVFARRAGEVWFLAVLNGVTPRKIQVPLSFLGNGGYQTVLVRDLPDETASQVTLERSMNKANAMTIELVQGGGFLARFTPD